MAAEKNFCKYHPAQPATYTCEHCNTFNCDACVDEGKNGLDVKCYTCQRLVEHLGAVNHAVPFWRRLEASFRYPLTQRSMALIIGVAVLVNIFVYVPLNMLWILLTVGAFLKYCFSCMETSSRGILVPPDISEAYGGGLKVLGALILIIIVMVATVGLSARFLGMQMAGLIGFLIIIASPAIIILYGISDDIREALNPLNVYQLISAIGLPYGLLLAFIMIMSGSVSIINELLSFDGYSMPAAIAQTMVSNYYSVVLFHLMGYVIFQYQGELGFVAREDTGEARVLRSERDRIAAMLDITLKEGNYNTLVQMYEDALKKYPKDKIFNRNLFEFLYATRRVQVIDAAATRYMKFMMANGMDHQLTMLYKRVLQLCPAFMPDDPALRHRLAEGVRNTGDSRTALRFLNGLHKLYPQYPKLPEAIGLMADTLQDLPDTEVQVQKCRQLAQHLAKIRAEEEAKRPAKPAKVTPTGAKVVPAGSKVKSDHVAAPDATAQRPAATPLDSLEPPKDLPPIEFKL